MKNKIYNICRALSLALPLFATLSVRAEQIDTLLHFNYADLRADTVTAPDGNTYTKLAYPGCGEGEEVGAPSLPITYVSFTLPGNSEGISLSIQAVNEASHSLKYDIFPIQPGVAYKFPLTDVEFFSPAYGMINTYPINRACIKSNRLNKEGNRRIVVAVFPITYEPSQKRYYMCDSFRVTLSYEKTVQSDFQEKRVSSRVLSGLPYYQYCVITSRELKDSFRRLVAWQQQKGLNAGVVCIEDILDNNVLLQNHGETNSIQDPGPYSNVQAGMLRQYLREAVDPARLSTERTEYVLLGGDYNIIPTRYAKRKDTISGATEDDKLIPSDWYYTELNSSWYRNSDYHEFTDSLDCSADLNVGRLLCNTGEQVRNYTDKLLRYELNPGNGDYTYLKKAIYLQADDGQEGHDANRVANSDSIVFTTRTILEEYPSLDSLNPTFPSGNDVISSINNRYGYASFYSHGNPYIIQTMTKGKNNTGDPYNKRTNALTSLQGIDTLAPMEIESETSNGLNNLTNRYYPMLMYSASCTSMPFDYSNVYYNFNPDVPNVGRSLTTYGDYGCAAYVGNTRLGIVKWSSILQKRYNLKLLDYPIAEALNKAKLWYANVDTNKYEQYLLLSVNLLGSPNIRMWTDTPKLFNATLDEEGQTIYANSTITNAQIILQDISQTDGNKSIFENIDFSVYGTYSGLFLSSCLIMLKGRNCIPQIMPLIIYEPCMEGTRYLFTKDVKCEGTCEDEVTFMNGSDYTFESNGTFRMTKHVKVEKGAKLKVIPSDINFK